MTSKPISISELIAPISIEHFFNTYWERKHLHLQKSTDTYDGLFSLADIDDFLTKQNLKPEGIKLVRDGKQIANSLWTNTTKLLDGTQNIVVVPDLILKHYYDGATIIISFADTMIPALAAINRNIEQELGMRSQANIYITPPNAQGFTLHYDTHDIFLLQLKGPKTWNIYDTGEHLPTSIEPFKNEPSLIERITINTGDFLYMPRGIVHEAYSSETSTIHVNFSLKPTYGFRLIEALAELAEKEDVFFRKVIPNRFSSDEQRKDYFSAFNEKLMELLAKHPVEELIKKQDAHFIERQNIDLTGRLLDAIVIEQISALTTISRRTGIKYIIETDAQSTIIRFGKKKIVLPKFVDKELFLQDTPFKINEIKGLLTEENKMALVRTLIQAGYLKIVN